MNTPTDTVSERDIFLQQLRSDTAGWHQKLEGLDASKAILSENVSKEQYIRYLETMYGFIKPFETAVYPQLSTEIPDIENRRKTSLIENDLALLGLATERINQLPLYPVSEDLDTARALGMLYVIEGSTLGGAIIYKHIHNTLGIDAQSGAAYFQPYGQQAGSYWKVFINHLVEFSVGQKKQQAVIEAATATFRNIHDWFLNSSLLQYKA